MKKTLLICSLLSVAAFAGMNLFAATAEEELVQICLQLRESARDEQKAGNLIGYMFWADIYNSECGGSLPPR